MAKKKPEAPIQIPRRRPAQAFQLIRQEDETGISGTGMVGEGCVFGNGKCCFCFESAHPSVSTWDSFEAFKFVHIDSHPGNKSIIVWLNNSGETSD